MEFLKEHLGDELFAQLAEKLKGNDKVKLANLAGGEYMPRDKGNTITEQVKTLTGQLTERDAQLEALKKTAGDSSAMQVQIAELQQANKAATEAHAAEVAAMRLDSALDGFLRDNKAKNAKAVRALLDMKTVKLDGDTLLGVDEQVKALLKSDAYLFEGTDDFPGAPNPAGGGTPPDKAPNPGSLQAIQNSLGAFFKG